VAAFSVDDDDGRERVVVVLETRAKESETLGELRREVGSVITSMAGVAGEVVLAPPRSLTFTSSGKLSRAAAKTDYLAGTIEDIAGDLSPCPSVEPEVRLAAAAGR
jgi:fatty-acyl-CoA synthase